MAQTDPDSKTGTKLLRILSVIDERGSVGVTELARELDVAKSTAHYHLETLGDEGFVVKEGDEYRLSLKFLTIGAGVRRRFPLYEAAKGEIDKLADETGELAILLVEERGIGVYLYKATGSNAIDVDARTGRRATLHNRALGKAILAHLDRSRVEEIVAEHGLPATTDQTITTAEELFDELERIRTEGVAYNREEATEGIHGVGVPILGADDEVLGSVSIAGPAKRLEGETLTKHYSELLSRSRNVIELNVQHSEIP